MVSNLSAFRSAGQKHTIITEQNPSFAGREHAYGPTGLDSLSELHQRIVRPRDSPTLRAAGMQLKASPFGKRDDSL